MPGPRIFRSNRTKILVTVAVVMVGAATLVYSSRADAQYYKMVDELDKELKAEPKKWEGRTLRVHGYVVSGTIDENIVAQKTVRTFVLEHNASRIKVHHSGPVPDTFREKSEVVAKGKLVVRDGTFMLEATEIMAKCPSKYEGKPKTNPNGYGSTSKDQQIF